MNLALSSSKSQEKKMFDWIDINARLPPNDVYVLVCNRHLKAEMNFVKIGKRFNGKWFDGHNEEEIEVKKYCITHWMVLPDDPSKCVEREGKEQILDKAWVSMTEHIKLTVQEEMSKDDYFFEIWTAISEGVTDFLSEKFMSNAFEEKFRDLEITFKLKKD